MKFEAVNGSHNTYRWYDRDEKTYKYRELTIQGPYRDEADGKYTIKSIGAQFTKKQMEQIIQIIKEAERQ